MPLTTSELLEACDLKIHQLLYLRRKHPELAPVKTIPPHSYLWAPGTVELVKRLRALRNRRRA